MDLTLIAGRYNALSNDAYHAFRRSAENGEDPWTAAINAVTQPAAFPTSAAASPGMMHVHEIRATDR
jgi:hypothetical protein